MRKNIFLPRGKAIKCTLSKNIKFNLDKNFFKEFSNAKIPYIHFKSTKNPLKHLIIIPSNHSIIECKDKAIGKWKILNIRKISKDDDASIDIFAVLINKQNVIKEITYPKALSEDEFTINDTLCVVPLGLSEEEV